MLYEIEREKKLDGNEEEDIMCVHLPDVYSKRQHMVYIRTTLPNI